MSVDLDQVLLAKQQYASSLLARDHVVGVGVGYKEVNGARTNELAVVVNVQRKVPLNQLPESQVVPGEVNGIQTDVVQTGQFFAGQAPPEVNLPLEDVEVPVEEVPVKVEATQGRWRPLIPPGVSIGHLAVSAGTLGCLVKRGEDIFILSNNHVLAHLNTGEPGDAILQPARYDGGTLDDRVAVLADYIPLDFGGEKPDSGLAVGVENVFNWLAERLGANQRVAAYRGTGGANLVDAALARPLDPARFRTEIFRIGAPEGVRRASLGTQVQKTGRTTGYTTGEIVQVDVTAEVNYNGRKARFTGQLLAGAMSQGGDSGAVVLDQDRYAVGLLFAGSVNSTMINPIETVLDLLDVELVT